MTLRPRPARRADLPALAALDVLAFGDHAYPSFFFRQALDVFGGGLLVVPAPTGAEGSEGAALGGYVLAARAQGGGLGQASDPSGKASGSIGEASNASLPEASGPAGWILSAAVHPRCRGRGLGEGLTRAALRYLGRQGAREAWLTVEPHNEAAQRLYRRCGFRDAGEAADYFGPGEGRLVMRCPLPPPGSEASGPQVASPGEGSG